MRAQVEDFTIDHVDCTHSDDLQVAIESPLEIYALHSFKEVIANHIIAIARKAMAGAKSLGLSEILVSTCIKTEVYLFKVRESLMTEFLIRQPANSVSLEIKVPQASRVLVRGYANFYPPQLAGLEGKRIACFHSLEFKSPRLIVENSKPDVLIIWGAIRWR